MKQKKDVASEVRSLEQRLTGLESVQVMIHHVQVDSLKQAEKLRKLVVAMMKSRCSARLAALRKLEVFVADLQPFWKNPGPMPKALKQLLARHRKAAR